MKWIAYMKHAAIEQIFERAEQSKSDSDYTYFFSLLNASEGLFKCIVLGIVACIADEKERHRYRLEHQLVHADGIGEWGRVIEDALTGPASQYLLVEARNIQKNITQVCLQGTWQYEATIAIKRALISLNIESEEVPTKSDLKRWFRLFATLRNKTRGHGATTILQAASAAELLKHSIKLIYENIQLFRLPWAYLHKNLSGKYRVSAITENIAEFDYLKQLNQENFLNGVYLFMNTPRRISLIHTDAEIRDFYFVNGGHNGKKFEFLSYQTNNRADGDASAYSTPPSDLPPSETQGYGELVPIGKCFSNVPVLTSDFVSRSLLEEELLKLLKDERRSIITLVGRGGIGKTSLAIKVIQSLYEQEYYKLIVWFSARDVDLLFTGPKQVQPMVLSPENVGMQYAELVLSPDQYSSKEFNAKKFIEAELQNCKYGPCLFVFDNFETMQDPIESFKWIDTFIRPPNKVLITTRLREFKGDYPVEISGMKNDEAHILITKTAAQINVSNLLTKNYIQELIVKSDGHPYVMKILLGEVAKHGIAKNIPQMIAGTEDILTALFERTYVSLSPCAQRAFLTLSAWNSSVPRLVLEAVLFQSTSERSEVEKGIELLVQYSMAEIDRSPLDQQEFIRLPLVASIFGKKKFKVSPSKTAIQADVQILQMLGPSRANDFTNGLSQLIYKFVQNIAKAVDANKPFEAFSPVLEVICRAYNPGWLLLGKLHMEERTFAGYKRAENVLRIFLENSPPSDEAIDAWRLLGYACRETNNYFGEIHAFIERAHIAGISFRDLSNTANKFNSFITDLGVEIDKEEKRTLANRLHKIIKVRISEADSEDLSRVAWLAIHAGQEFTAREYVTLGLKMAVISPHLNKLAQRFGIETDH